MAPHTPKKAVSRLVALFEHSTPRAPATPVNPSSYDQPLLSSAAPPGESAPVAARRVPVRRGTVKERVEAFSGPPATDSPTATGNDMTEKKDDDSRSVVSEGWGSLVRDAEREMFARRATDQQNHKAHQISQEPPPTMAQIPEEDEVKRPSIHSQDSLGPPPSFTSLPQSPPPPISPFGSTSTATAKPFILPTILSAPAELPTYLPPSTLVPASHLFSSKSLELLLPELDSVLDAIEPLVLPPVNFTSPSELKGWQDWMGAHPEGWWSRMKARLRGESSGQPKQSARYAELEEGDADGSEAIKRGSAEEKALIMPPMHLVPPRMTVSDLKLNRLKPPPLFTTNDVLEKGIDWPLAAESSSFGLSLETLTSIRDVIQMVSLLSTSIAKLSSASWFQTVFVTVPSALALDFVSVWGRAIVWLWVFTIIAFGCLYELYRLTGGWSGSTPRSKNHGEGFDCEGSAKTGKLKPKLRNSRGYTIAVTFIAGSLFLPLSKLALGALFWTEDYWAVSNPYLTSDFPSPASLGPADEVYPALDFCYRTTMHRPSGLQHLNWAIPILAVAGLTVLLLGIWFPIRLWFVISREAPSVDVFTELGRKRRDTAGEYIRILSQDTGAFNFLYEAYRQPWRNYKPIYMGVKLLNVLVITLVTKDNCLFRSHTRHDLDVLREGVLLALMTLFLALELYSAPYSSLPSNHSDLVSRGGYVLIVFFGLMTALGAKGEALWSGTGSIVLNVVIYGLNGYFALIGLQIFERLVKRLNYRLDFSIDLFSPRLDIGLHTKVRVWQDTIAAVLLAGPEYKMDKDLKLMFTTDTGLSPYLINFRGSPAERLVEDLKVLRQVGGQSYSDALETFDRTADLRARIARDWTGPDIFFVPRQGTHQVPKSITSFFGRVDLFPFPFRAVMRYDQDKKGEYVLVLTHEEDWQRLIDLNEQEDVIAMRRVRLGLRALEGVEVSIPFDDGAVQSLKAKMRKRRPRVGIRYERGTIRIKRNSAFQWEGYNHSSGFQVSVEYRDGLGASLTAPLRRATIPASRVLGLTDSFELTPAIHRLFTHHTELLEKNMLQVETALEAHRAFFAAEAERKFSTLSPGFLPRVLHQPMPSVSQIDDTLRKHEADQGVSQMAERYSYAFDLLVRRMEWLGQSSLHAFWALFWDEVWRRNQQVTEIVSQPAVFSPHYRTFIGYKPMSRGKLEAFLRARGFGVRGYFHVGFLNRLYFYLSELAFASHSPLHPALHLGRSASLHSFSTLFLTSAHSTQDPSDSRLLMGNNRRVQSAGTGDGTDFDARSLHSRRAFKFEEVWAAEESNRVEKSIANWFALGWLLKRTTRKGGKKVVEVELELVRANGGWALPVARSGSR